MTPLDTLKILRPEYPTPIGDDNAVALLNRVAWEHRVSGWGLLAKPNGAKGRQPQTGTLCSRDILMQPDGRIWDVFIDVDNEARPVWSPKADIDPSRFVKAVDSSISLPPPVIIRPYPGDHIGRQIGDFLFSDYARAEHDCDAGMMIWAWRVAWDCANPPYLTPAQSLEKHRSEWLAILGL